MISTPQARAALDGGEPVPDGLEARMRASAGVLRSILAENILPFWERRVVDRERGGYHLNHDLRGASLGPAPRHLVAQSQTLWFLSRLAASGERVPWAASAARHGYDYLRERMLDDRHGGFYWEVSPSGRPSKPHKHLMGQACALQALCEYGQALADPDAHRLAAEVAAVIERGRDAELGGYLELWRSDWSEPAHDPGYFTRDPEEKTFATHLHLLESLAAHEAVNPSRDGAKACAELDDLVAAMPARRGLLRAYRFRRNWESIAPRFSYRVDYGHELKRISLVMLAGATTRRASAEDHRRSLDAVLRVGYDRPNGGFFALGPPGLPATRREKVWWIQAEGLTCLLRMHLLSGEARYGEAFLGTLGWIERYQADWEWGDWHEEVDRRGRPRGNKAWKWKTPYHQGRAMLDCLELLAGAYDRGEVGA